MAKKEKKSKKAKAPKKGKGRKSSEEQELESDLPYAGSDGVKTTLARLICVLSAICLGLMVYTVHYFHFHETRLRNEAAQAYAAAEAEKAASMKGPIWFSMPDGTVVSGSNRQLVSVDEVQPEKPPQAAAVMVWHADSGTLYHSRSDCEGMEPGGAAQIPMAEALEQGLERCEQCW